MLTVDIKSLLKRLNSYCTSCLEGAAGLCVSRTHYEVTVEHVLVKLLENPHFEVMRHDVGVFFDADLIVPDSALSVNDGAIAPFKGRGRASRYYASMLGSLSTHLGFDLDTPWKRLPAKIRKQILNGSGDREMVFRFGRRGGFSFSRSWPGVIGYLDKRYRDTESDTIREDLRRYMNMSSCPECGGGRLRPLTIAG